MLARALGVAGPPWGQKLPARNPDTNVCGLCGAGKSAVPMRLGLGLRWDGRRFACPALRYAAEFPNGPDSTPAQPSGVITTETALRRPEPPFMTVFLVLAVCARALALRAGSR